jgi:hypothetical protein
MKLKLLREHYRTTDNGRTWIVKKSFKSIEEIQDAGYFPNKWHAYTCRLCGNFHVSSIAKKEVPK